MTLQNTILAGNTASGTGPDCNGSVGSLGYNLIGDTTDCTFTSGTGDLTDVGPNLGPFIGSPGYHPLLSGSPAIDAGNPAGCTDHLGNLLDADQRGAPRVGRCDIEAYEYTIPDLGASIFAFSGTPQRAAPFTAFGMPLRALVLDSIGSPVSGTVVTFSAPESGASGTFADSDTFTTTAATDESGVATVATFTANELLGSYVVTAMVSGVVTPAHFLLSNILWYVAPGGDDADDCQTPTTPCATINGALGKAGFVAGDTVLVAGGTYTSTDSQVVLLDRDATLSGGWDASFTTRSGTSTIDGEDSRRGVTVNSGVTAIVERFVVQYGSSSYGGGIRNDGTLTLDNSIVSDSSDGGIRNHGILTLNDSTVSGNSGDGIYSSSNLTLKNSTISDNSGNGVYLSDNSGATLTNNIISDNSGSGLYIKGSSPRLLHTTIARNSGGDGSGVYVTEDVGMFYSFYSTVALTNTILVSHAVGVYVTADNTATLEGTLWGDGAWANGTDWSGEGNITTGTVNLWGDPAFLDPDDGDYHISFGSAAVDAGVDAGVTDDIDGDPRTDGYPDMGADELMGALLVTKQAYPDPVQPGAPLTYTIRVTNTGDFALHATITDTLPTYVTTGETAGGTTVLPGGRLVWTPVITTPHGVWVRTVVVTVELGYAGSLTNVVQVTTDEGAMGVYTETSVTAPSNRAPYTPSNPAPADGASNVPLTQTLSWQGGDPNAGDTVTYAVALGTSDPPLFATTTTLTSYTPSLVTNTTYCWVITATDGISAVVGPMWRFTTLGLQYIYLPVVLRDSP